MRAASTMVLFYCVGNSNDGVVVFSVQQQQWCCCMMWAAATLVLLYGVGSSNTGVVAWCGQQQHGCCYIMWAAQQWCRCIAAGCGSCLQAVLRLCIVWLFGGHVCKLYRAERVATPGFPAHFPCWCSISNVVRLVIHHGVAASLMLRSVISLCLYPRLPG